MWQSHDEQISATVVAGAGAAAATPLFCARVCAARVGVESVKEGGEAKKAGSSRKCVQRDLRRSQSTNLSAI